MLVSRFCFATNPDSNVRILEIGERGEVIVVDRGEKRGVNAQDIGWFPIPKKLIKREKYYSILIEGLLEWDGKESNYLELEKVSTWLPGSEPGTLEVRDLEKDHRIVDSIKFRESETTKLFDSLIEEMVKKERIGPKVKRGKSKERDESYYGRNLRERDEGGFDGHELVYQYSQDLVDNAPESNEGHQGKATAYSLGYEYYLKRIFESYDSLSLDVYFTFARAYYDVEGINAASSERSFKCGVNWYPLNSSSDIDKFLLYLGLGIRYGKASLNNHRYSLYGDYQLTSLPVVNMGIKYRFKEMTDAKIGLGVKFHLSYESINLELIEEGSENAISPVVTTQYKFVAGVGLYF